MIAHLGRKIFQYNFNYSNIKITNSIKKLQINTVSKLVEKGAFVNSPDDEGDTPLMKAIKHGHTETVELMLKRFAEVDAKNKVNFYFIFFNV